MRRKLLKKENIEQHNAINHPVSAKKEKILTITKRKYS